MPFDILGAYSQNPAYFAPKRMISFILLGLGSLRLALKSVRSMPGLYSVHSL